MSVTPTLVTPTPVGPTSVGLPTQRVTAIRAPRRFFFGLFLAQFGIFVALITPVVVSMQLKATQLAPDNPAGLIGAVLPFGALGALLANPLAGALSDRTRTRWGRRRPWLVGGIVVFVGALVCVAYVQDQLSLTIAWVLAQVAANAALAALFASFADNVPGFQRGWGSSVIAVAQNVAILAGVYLSVGLTSNLSMLFIAPGVLAVGFVLVYAFVVRDELPDNKLEPLTFLTVISSFWTNPVKNPDFGFAWWSRFLITLATCMFTTYRFLYMQQHLGIKSEPDAAAAVALGVLLYTVALLVSSAISGWISDRTGRRKIFVGGSTALFGFGLTLLAHADTVEWFYCAELVMGLAFGVYTAVDNALVVDVLPDADQPGKDLGVFNIANAMPQTLAPAVALFFLGIGSAANQNYAAMLWAAGAIGILGALAIIPIKRVR
ncbi:MFS transporter [bacterium RCC_150]